MALATVLLASCARRDDVRVRVTSAGGAGAAPVENVTVFVGGSKSWWPSIAAGETVSVVLSPEGEPPETTMTYTTSGRRHDWRGPALAKGRGHLIAIEVAPDGTATERHCSTPCSLP